MNQNSARRDVLWISSEICYYLGLVCSALLIPTIALILWMMSLVGKADPNYWYIFIAWGISGLVFAIGIGLKNWIYSNRE